MGLKDDYQKAVELAKKGKYAKAKAILEPYKDHSKVKTLYDKIIEKLSEQPFGKFQLLPAKQQHSAIAVIATLLLCGCCWFLFSLIPEDKERGYATSVCARVTFHYDQGCSVDWLVEYNLEAIQSCMPEGEFVNTDDNIDFAIVCLEYQGVDVLQGFDP